MDDAVIAAAIVHDYAMENDIRTDSNIQQQPVIDGTDNVDAAVATTVNRSSNPNSTVIDDYLDEEEEEEKDYIPNEQQQQPNIVTWFTFFSHREQREYYYEPISGTTTWIAPSQTTTINTTEYDIDDTIYTTDNNNDEINHSSAFSDWGNRVRNAITNKILLVSHSVSSPELQQRMEFMKQYIIETHQHRILPIITKRPVALLLLFLNIALYYIWVRDGSCCDLVGTMNATTTTTTTTTDTSNNITTIIKNTTGTTATLTTMTPLLESNGNTDHHTCCHHETVHVGSDDAKNGSRNIDDPDDDAVTTTSRTVTESILATTETEKIGSDEFKTNASSSSARVTKEESANGIDEGIKNEKIVNDKINESSGTVTITNDGTTLNRVVGVVDAGTKRNNKDNTVLIPPVVVNVSEPEMKVLVKNDVVVEPHVSGTPHDTEPNNSQKASSTTTTTTTPPKKTTATTSTNDVNFTVKDDDEVLESTPTNITLPVSTNGKEDVGKGEVDTDTTTTEEKTIHRTTIINATNIQNEELEAIQRDTMMVVQRVGMTAINAGYMIDLEPNITTPTSTTVTNNDTTAAKQQQ